MQLLNPYLHFNGQCEEAFNFYARVLGSRIRARRPRSMCPPSGATRSSMRG
jgi:uncharacterized glyoxalase superfamily protein PhnB